MTKAMAVQPIFTSASGRFHDWLAVIAAARRLPNTWMPVYWDCPTATYVAVRERRHVDLKTIEGGTLEAQARNKYTDEDGRKMCSLFVRFIPEGEQP